MACVLVRLRRWCICTEVAAAALVTEHRHDDHDALDDGLPPAFHDSPLANLTVCFFDACQRERDTDGAGWSRDDGEGAERRGEERGEEGAAVKDCARMPIETVARARDAFSQMLCITS